MWALRVQPAVHPAFTRMGHQGWVSSATVHRKTHSASTPSRPVQAPGPAPEPASVTHARGGTRPRSVEVARLDDTTARVVAIVAILLVLAEAVADVLPDGPILWIVTPLRAVILLGFAAAAAGALVRVWPSRAQGFRRPVARLPRLPRFSVSSLLWWLGSALVLLTTAIAS